MNVLQLSGTGLRCMRGGRQVFAGIQFSVAAGDALEVVGVNGVGKSSLLRMIAGLLPVDHGAITLNGGGHELTLAEQVHYLGHRDALKPSLTVAENLRFWRDFLGGTRAGFHSGDIHSCIEAAGLTHAADVPAGYLSAGQRRRLSIARLLIVRRPVWLLDEPASALDAGGQKLFSALMTDHLKNGGLLLAATHAPLGIGAQELRIGGGI